MNLQESGEMYLETIYVLHKELETVRSIDLATAMNFSKPSISRAVHNLKNGGYLEIEPSGNLLLTPKGEKIATRIYERHVFFTNYFIAIGVETEKAVEDACSIEHAISEESFRKMKQHITTCLAWEDYDHYAEYVRKRKDFTAKNS